MRAPAAQGEQMRPDSMTQQATLQAWRLLDSVSE